MTALPCGTAQRDRPTGKYLRTYTTSDSKQTHTSHLTVAPPPLPTTVQPPAHCTYPQTAPQGCLHLAINHHTILFCCLDEAFPPKWAGVSESLIPPASHLAHNAHVKQWLRWQFAATRAAHNNNSKRSSPHPQSQIMPQLPPQLLGTPEIPNAFNHHGKF